MSMLTDSSNSNKKKDFKIEKKCDKNLNDLFLKIKIKKIKKSKLSVIKNFDMNNVLNVYKKEIIFYKTLNHILQKQLIN